MSQGKPMPDSMIRVGQKGPSDDYRPTITSEALVQQYFRGPEFDPILTL